MAEKPEFPPALCNRCRHMGEAEGSYRKAYVQCKFPVMLSAAMRLHSVSIIHSDRLIPRHALVGFSDNTRFNQCPCFESRSRNTVLEQDATPVITPPPIKSPGLTTLLAPFIPEKSNV